MAFVAHRKRSMWLVLRVAVPRFTAAALFDFTGATWIGYLSGSRGMFLAVAALYTAFALMLEDRRGEEVLPVGRRGPAHEAVEGSLAVQLRNLERQAGVRRTLGGGERRNGPPAVQGSSACRKRRATRCHG
ncbi:hypothetical protein ACIQ6Y_32990 [Streptomyces sp. NPDC096205]|uniref:hypothetical protein n=1 Tax=Streptomyces sp. NPDC096205 TaxID=3366081 RepID=UPI0037FC47DB